MGDEINMLCLKTRLSARRQKLYILKELWGGKYPEVALDTATGNI